MKNKKNIYILLPAVVLIWGVLGYKIFSGLEPTSSSQEQLTVSAFKPQELEETEPFTISLDYRDPFLGTYERKKPTTKKVARKIKKTPKIPFPTIVYKGMISSQGQHGVFLITVNGQQFFFNKNNIHKEVKLVRGTKKEVILKFHGQRQTFKISK